MNSTFFGEYSANFSTMSSTNRGDCSPSAFVSRFSPLNMALRYCFRASLSPSGSGEWYMPPDMTVLHRCLSSAFFSSTSTLAPASAAAMAAHAPAPP